MTRILVVEDDPYLRASLRFPLELNGYEVAVAANGKKALAHLRSSGADIVITDLFMPEMDGFELIAAIKESFPKIKIVAISGGGLLSSGKMFRGLCKNSGVHFQEKPFSAGQLIATIAEIAQSDTTQRRQS